jgi:two-component system OmpR family sensor kinase
MKLRPILIIIPLILGALSSALAQAFFSPVPVLVFKIDIGMTTFVTGIFFTLLFGMFWLGGLLRRREAEKRMLSARRETEESRRRFIRRLDHEIKNPLTGLQAALVNIQEASGQADRQQAGQNARTALERLKRLLADLRKLSDLEERPIERLAVDVPELLDEMVEAARAIPAYAGRRVDLFVSRVPWPFPPVTGDRDLLGLAVYNLLENALKFTSGDDSVEIRALEDGKVIVVEVADSGPGIPPEELSKIFEELYRGANARGIEGSGLGLALVQRIVALHGGQVAVRSSQDGPRGTVFTIRLPVGKK